MKSGEEIIHLYEKLYKTTMAPDRREFLVEAIDYALKEVYEEAQKDVLRVAKIIAEREKVGG